MAAVGLHMECARVLNSLSPGHHSSSHGRQWPSPSAALGLVVLPDASRAFLKAPTHLFSYLLWPEGHTTVLQSHSGANTGYLEA